MAAREAEILRLEEEERKAAEKDEEGDSQEGQTQRLSDGEYGDQDGDEEDEIEYEVFYDIHDIRDTLENQEKNIFSDIIKTAAESKID